MTNIRPFIRDASFNPEAVHAMSLAFDNAKALINQHDAQSYEALAVRIITLASCGELDPDRLAAAAVRSFVAWSNGTPAGPSIVPDHSPAIGYRPAEDEARR